MIDCGEYVNRCGVVVAEAANLATVTHTGLGFSRVTVVPSRGLVNTPVAVSGGGFTADAQLLVNQCGAEATSPAGCSSEPVTVAANPDGTYSANFTTHRHLVTQEIGTIDCGEYVNRCGIVVAEAANLATVTHTGLGFGSVTVTPSFGLRTNDTVTVSGTGFPPNVTLAVRQCSNEYPTACDYDGRSTTTDANGAYSTSVAVRRTWDVPPYYYSCYVDMCNIRVEVIDDERMWASQRILFTIGGISVSPTTVVDGQTVQVTVLGLDPYTEIELAQCVSDAIGETCTSWRPETVGEDTYIGPFTVQRYLQTQFGRVDCGASGGRCGIVVRLADDPTRWARESLYFN
jgi:hypothetical protein